MITARTFDELYPEGEKAKPRENITWHDVKIWCQICTAWTHWRNADFGTYLCSEQCYADYILLEQVVKSGYVYFIQSEDSNFYKIGRSANPDQRIENMRTAAVQRLHLGKKIYTGDMLGLEHLLHHIFGQAPHRRIRGEWFELIPDTEEYHFWMAIDRLEAWEVQVLLVRHGLRDIEGFGII
jgi:hypothetical protein